MDEKRARLTEEIVNTRQSRYPLGIKLSVAKGLRLNIWTRHFIRTAWIDPGFSPDYRGRPTREMWIVRGMKCTPFVCPTQVNFGGISFEKTRFL